jgi:AraC-like DNA-binding protein
MAAATDPAAGLYIGSQLSGSQCTLMQLAAKANNLATALLQSIQILQRSWPELQLTLQPDQHYSRISLACQHAWLERPLVEASSLILQRLATYTNAGQCRPTELRLAYPEPEYGHLYAIFFACPVSFHCGVNQLLFRNYDLHQPLQPSRLTLPFSVQVEHRLERAWGYFPRIEQMATELGLSARTLRRRLQDEGCHYQQLVEQQRRERARLLLGNGAFSVHTVSRLLGYSDPANFSRACRQWFGLSPRAMRPGKTE